MGCVSSRDVDSKWAIGATGHDSPISSSSFPDKIHVCRMKSAASLSNMESKKSHKSYTSKGVMHSRRRLDSVNASASTDASLPRTRMKYQRERRYMDV